MKQGLIIGIISVVIFTAVLALGFKKHEVPKTYTVTLTKDQWVSALTIVDSTQRLLLKSDLPTKEVIGVNTGLTQLVQIISSQVSAQLTKEQEAAAKKDSTTHKK